MTIPENAARATRVLRRAMDAVPEPAESPMHDVAVAKIREALLARARRRRMNRAFGAVAVAAGVLALIGGGALVATRMASAPLAWTAGGQGLSVGDHVQAPASDTVGLDFPTGSHVTVAKASEVSIVQQGRANVLALDRGAVALRVAKLTKDERFVVRTVDAEVEVRGTAFEVELAQPRPECGSSRTRVRVTEGIVVVRHAGAEARVAAGESWPSCEGPKASVATMVPAPAAAPAPTPSHPAPSVAPVPKPALSSTLTEQNDLFERAMAARRSGANAAAVATFDRLLAEYPRGPLVESATVERMRALTSTDPARAQREATMYLRHWPNGFGRRDAEAILARPR